MKKPWILLVGVTFVYSGGTRQVDQTVKEWDRESKKCIKTFSGHTHIVNSAVYSADGEKILSVSDDRVTKEWESLSGKFLNTLDMSSANLWNDLYSPDRKKYLYSLSIYFFREWYRAEGETFQVIEGKYSVF
jgi:WD40 repeat protein